MLRPRDGSRLGRLGVLAPAALSACMEASVLAVPAAGAIVSTVLKELSKAFMLKKWFHGSMSAKQAEQLMMERGNNGSFLVRESLTRPGELVLSVRVRGRVSHVMIRRQDDKYDVGSGEQFDDLVGLIEHFRLHPMVEASGDVLRLLQPVSGVKLRPNDVRNKLNDQQEMKDEVDDECGFDGEYRILKLLEDSFAFTTHEGAKSQNTHKNRYRNILPYDQTRVVLRGDDVAGADYINASFIRSPRLDSTRSSASSDLHSSNESIDSTHYMVFRNESSSTGPLVSTSLSDEALREVKRYINLDDVNGNLNQNIVKDKVYIATQGCMANTIDDFWLMIRQEDVRVIAMITNEVERGKRKCDRYWPLPGQEERYGGLRIKAGSEISYGDYLMRELYVHDLKGCTIVYQYQFKVWPDHAAPDSSEGVLAFIEDVNTRMYHISQSKAPPEQNVLCVHCSAGVGRTGTFIALDMLIDKIKASGFECDIDVAATVRLVRAQRAGMVQNKAQYRFIYLALQHYIQNKNLTLRRKVYTSDA